MENLVELLYNAIPEYKEVNDPFFDEFDYTVYGSFGLFLEDLATFQKNDSLIKRHFDYCEVEQKFNRKEMENILKRGFEFIESLYGEDDKHMKDVIHTTFFKIVVTSDELLQYSKQYFTSSLYMKMLRIWNKK